MKCYEKLLYVISHNFQCNSSYFNCDLMSFSDFRELFKYSRKPDNPIEYFKDTLHLCKLHTHMMKNRRNSNWQEIMLFRSVIDVISMS